VSNSRDGLRQGDGRKATPGFSKRRGTAHWDSLFPVKVPWCSAVWAAGLVVACSLLAQQSTQSTQGDAQQTAPPSTAPAAAPPLPDSPDSHAGPQATGPTAVFDTTMGRITCRLFDKQAPEAVANFVGLAEGTKDWIDPATKQKEQGKPFYDGTTFHRVIPEFMIQGGDPLGTGMGDPGYMFKDEFDPALNFDVAGRLAMANSGPNTNGSQFFITEAPEDYLDQKYTIFGQCDDASVWVVKAIARVNRNGQDKPLDPVVIRKVTIVAAGQPLPPAPSTPTASTSAAPAPQQR
jgi:peptidyl-prolyl cis-trans isomerase A (cyclophilin A)